MKYLAILGYDCGCEMEANYGFIKPVRFYATTAGDLEQKFQELQKRKSRITDGHQCKRKEPIEVIVFNEEMKVVREKRKK